MRIAFPTQDDQGLESQVYGHFGSANNFIVVDTETEDCETVDNRDREHDHGQCQPLAALGRKPVDAVVVGGIGRGALFKLNDGGVRVYRGVEGSIRENLVLINAGRLPVMTMEQTCAGHNHEQGGGRGGQCAH